MYTNTVRTRTLTLKNTGNEKLEVYFSSDAVDSMVWFTVSNVDSPKTPSEDIKDISDETVTTELNDDAEPQRVEELALLPNSSQRVTVSYKYVTKPRLGGATPGTPADKEVGHFAYHPTDEEETRLAPKKFK